METVFDFLDKREFKKIIFTLDKKKLRNISIIELSYISYLENYSSSLHQTYTFGLQGQWQSLLVACHVFFHSISYLVAIFFLKIQSCFYQKELLKITWKSLPKGFKACWLQWWWLEVCLTNSLWDILVTNINIYLK